MTTVKTITEAIAAANPTANAEQFNITRYPWTYAADYLRQRPNIVPDEVWDNPDLWTAQHSEPMSRPAAARVLQTWSGLLGVSDLEAAIELADAYLAAAGIRPSDADLDEALALNTARTDR